MKTDYNPGDKIKVINIKSGDEHGQVEGSELHYQDLIGEKGEIVRQDRYNTYIVYFSEHQISTSIYFTEMRLLDPCKYSRRIANVQIH